MSEENKDAKGGEENVENTQQAPTTKASKAAQTPEERIKELEKLNKQLKKENEAKELKLHSLDREPQAVPDEVTVAMEKMRDEIEALQRKQASQPVVGLDGKKPKYQTKDRADLLPEGEAVTFTARSVMKVIPGYRDETGMEVLAPYNIIIMQYAASDQKMDGKEEEIINFCSYTTRWKKEIEFLRNHPEFDVTFSDNMNQVAGYNHKDYQFRVRAGHEIASMSPESVLSYAAQYKIRADGRSIKELKPIIMEAMVKDFVEQEKAKSDEIAERIFKQAPKHV